jgi:hypothetical protein
MAKSSDVMSMIYPNGGWIAVGDDFGGIQFLECEPLTKADYEKAALSYDAWVIEKKELKAAAKTDLLAKLGITEEEARLLLG